MNYWIIPQNEQHYRLGALLETTDVVDWHQRNNFEVGDIVYIYTTAPYKRIRFMMRVEEVNVPACEAIDDINYWVPPFLPEPNDRYVRLSLLQKEPPTGGPTLNEMMAVGLTHIIQSTMRIPNPSSLLNAIQAKMG